MDSRHLKRILIGTPFPLSAEHQERLDNFRGLAIFASDTISSNAYATEAIMAILILMGSAALGLAWPVAIAIATLVAIVVFSYSQTIMHYPLGGGSYTVAKDNLGRLPSLVAGAALLIDYVMTVAVSTSSGVRAVTSAFPELFPFRVAIALLILVLMTWINLRGLRESGSIFAFPTYAFVAGTYAVIGIGLARYFGIFGALPLEVHPEQVAATAEYTGFAMVWLVLRAFASGCTALTGIEAVSDGVMAFRKPESKNAVKVMVAMGFIAMTLLLGITYLASHLRIVPTEGNSVLSQMTELVAGRGLLYFWVQVFTALILFVAANTAYQDFPRLSSFLARDGFVPRWLQNRGDRLVFSSGIITLAVFASIIIIAFRADEIAMLPLYALGVMTGFTLSQAGMYRLMTRIGALKPGEVLTTIGTTAHYEPGWRWKRAVNGTGAVVTFTVLLVLIATKFTSGAWIVVVVVPAMVLLFLRIRRHYTDVATRLTTLEMSAADLDSVADVVVIPIADVHRGTLRALKFAHRLSNDIRVVNISQSEAGRQHILERWRRFPEITDRAKLIFIDYQYRDILQPLVDYIMHVHEVEFPNEITTVVVPEFIPGSIPAQFLHNKTANILRRRLMEYPNIVIIQVPSHIDVPTGPHEKLHTHN